MKTLPQDKDKSNRCWTIAGLPRGPENPELEELEITVVPTLRPNRANFDVAYVVGAHIVPMFKRAPRAEELLLKLKELIDVTGGIGQADYADKDVAVAPCADPEWVDLDTLYLEVCEHLGLEPVVAVAEADPFDEPLPERQPDCSGGECEVCQ
jgi:hypothetical protein